MADKKGKYELRLKSGNNWYDSASAFQKFVRRGMEHEALWVATDFHLSGYGEYLWYRMKVMVSEDIGLANPGLPAQVHALYEAGQEFKKRRNNKEGDKLPFVHAVLLLVRSEKSRLVDLKLCDYYVHRDTLEPLNLDDYGEYVYCMHTVKGKKLGRKAQHFHDQAAVINNQWDEIEEEYRYRDEILRKFLDKEQGKRPSVDPASGQTSFFENW